VIDMKRRRVKNRFIRLGLLVIMRIISSVYNYRCIKIYGTLQKGKKDLLNKVKGFLR